MRKKVCHMTSVHNRYDVRIYLKECISLAESGYDVTLVVNDDKGDEVSQGVKIVSTKFRPKNRLDRMLNSNRKIYEKAIETDADIYHFHDPELIPVGNKLLKKNKAVIFDSHEDVPKLIEDKKWIPRLFRRVIANLYGIYEEKSARKFNAIISVTPTIVRRFSKVNTNTVMVTNYPILKANEDKKRKPSNTICFAGGISSQWNHDKIIQSIENIDNIRYLLVGSGTNEYMSMLKSLTAWEKVDYKGRVPHSEVREIYAQSLAGMALNYSSQVKEEGTLGNTKLFEYMDAGLPIICSDYKLWREMVEEYNCGICVDPNNVEEIEKAIRYICSNPEQAEIMGQNGKKAVVEKYNWDTQKTILLDLYGKL